MWILGARKHSIYSTRLFSGTRIQSWGPRTTCWHESQGSLGRGRWELQREECWTWNLTVLSRLGQPSRMTPLALAGPRHWKGSENFMDDIPEHEECSVPRRFRVHGRNQPQIFPVCVLIRNPHLISCSLKTTTLNFLVASLMTQTVKNLPAIGETWVLSLGWEDPPWRKAWQPTPVFLPRESPWTEIGVHGVAKSQTQLSDSAHSTKSYFRCLSSGCYNKTILDWVAYKQQKFISHSSGGWEVQDQGASVVRF